MSTDSTGYLCTSSELEHVVGARPAVSGLKSIRFLDAHCQTLLAASTFVIVGTFATDGTPRTIALGGPSGRSAHPDGPTTLALDCGPLADVADDAPAGLLALVPGYRETLRVNGRLSTDGRTRLEVEEAFLHCAKALIRSRLWDPVAPSPPEEAVEKNSSILDGTVRAFLERAPFIALTSVDAGGNADVSPKGDPPGFVTVLDDATLAIPDRPGNRRTDTMHNLIERPELGVLALVPGDDRTLEIRGRARITDQLSVRRSMVVNAKVPEAAVLIEVDHAALGLDTALAASALWDTSQHVEPDALPRGSRIWVDHVKLNDDPGMAAKAMRLAMTETVLAAGLASDYRDNLY